MSVINRLDNFVDNVERGMRIEDIKQVMKEGMPLPKRCEIESKEHLQEVEKKDKSFMEVLAEPLVKQVEASQEVLVQ